MKNLFNYTKRWNALCKQQKDLDYQFALFARDLRAEFPKGDIGDKKFVKWCIEKLSGVDEFRAKTMLAQVVAVTIVPDEKTFKILGGEKQIAKLAPLDKKEQIATIEAVKLLGKAIPTVMRERAVAQGKLPPPPPRVNHRENAEKLAKFVRRSCKKVPKDIEMLLKHYPDLAPVLRSVA